jgi:hypothetical protein
MDPEPIRLILFHPRMGTTAVQVQELPVKYLSPLFVLFALCASVCTASEPNAIRDQILRNTTIQGYPCAKGEAWFYPDGTLNQCTLSRPAALGDLQVPRGSLVEFWPNGAAHYLMLQHSTVLAGHKVRGGTARGTQARGATTSFYSTGELRSFYLIRNESVQGIPCGGGSWNTFTDPGGSNTMVELYRDGKIESCKLSHDFAGFRVGQRINMPHLTLAADNKSIPAQ